MQRAAFTRVVNQDWATPAAFHVMFASFCARPGLLPAADGRHASWRSPHGTPRLMRRPLEQDGWPGRRGGQPANRAVTARSSRHGRDAPVSTRVIPNQQTREKTRSRASKPQHGRGGEAPAVPGRADRAAVVELTPRFYRHAPASQQHVWWRIASSMPAAAEELQLAMLAVGTCG